MYRDFVRDSRMEMSLFSSLEERIRFLCVATDMVINDEREKRVLRRNELKERELLILFCKCLKAEPRKFSFSAKKATQEK